MNKLQAHFDKLIRGTDTSFHRYLFSQIDWGTRMIGIVGARGVGKTTLVLQHIKEDLPRQESLYVTAEDLYFSTHQLVDLATEFEKMGGKYLFIDEIHKYKDWSRELKLIYDFNTELHVVFTGSSVLDIMDGLSDLSRRARMYQMQGLSYREYLSLFHGIYLPVCPLNDILQHRVDLPKNFHPLQHIPDYLVHGYYPFKVSADDFAAYMQQIVNITLEVDIPQYANLTISMSRKLKQLLGIIAQSAPFKPNFTSIGGQLGVSRNGVADMCAYIEKAGLVAQLREPTKGMQALGKVDKIYLDNTALIYALGDQQVDIGTVRETFFLNQTRLLHTVVSSPASDFMLNDCYTFEVGGKSKKQRQIRGIENAYIVKDDIETGYGNIIPLWEFGLLY